MAAQIAVSTTLTGQGVVNASIADPALLETAVYRRMLRFGACALIVVATIQIVDHELEHLPKALRADVFLLVGVAACVVLAELTHQYKQALNVMHGVLFGIVLVHAFLQGLVNTAAYWWLGVLPFVTVMTGTLWLAVLELLVFVAIGLSGAQSPFGGYYAVEPFEHKELHVALASIVGTVYSFLFVLQAYRWREQLHAALEDAREVAIEAAGAKARFLANMSHEIRTPLNGVIGATELLRTQTLNETQKAQLLSLQAQSAKALLALVNDVLDWSKLDVGKVLLEKGQVFLRGLVFESNELFAVAAFDKGIELTSSCDVQVPQHVLGDPTRLRQIVNNLVSNAVKFTNRGGVHIHLSVDAAEGSLEEVPRERPMRVIRVEVTDTGVGIEPEKIGTLFRAFVQGDETITRQFGGTGLGLAISQELAKLMGGYIEVASTLGQGSTFALIVPLEAVGEQPGSDTVPMPRGIVLAAASLGLQRHMTSLLHELGAEPIVVSELPRAQQLVGCRLLLVDAPLLAGLAVRSWIDRHSLNECRIVVMTPLSGDAVVGSLSDAMVLYKPVRRSSLRALLNAAAPEGAEPFAPRKPDAAAVLQARKGLRVLIAEDNSVNQVIVQAMLAELGATCRIVGNGRDSLDALRKEAFDLVLMDIRMPVTDGISATIELRGREVALGLSRIPVIAMTANSETDEGRACRAAGMDDFLTKPFGMQQLRRLLSTYGKQRDDAPAQDELWSAPSG
jgi:signal transduction histidine kinase